MNKPVLTVVIPCFNEEECLESTLSSLLNVLNSLECENLISEGSFIMCIDDGSCDKSWDIISRFNHEKNHKVKGIKFSRNFGNQKAILAGLTESRKYNADCYITVDADLQQDENKIKEFVEKYNAGAKIVLGIRKNRNTDDLFKKTTAVAFYKVMKFFGVNLQTNHSEFRLISREVVDALSAYKEVNIFLRGIVQQLGFKKDFVYFDVKPRKCGKSKFNVFSLFKLAVNGITSFSIVPLRMVTGIGLLMALISFIVGIFAIIDKYNGTCIVPGWATIVVLVGFVSGIQILCSGVIAEYLGQLFIEVKSRPRYIIESELN